MPKVSIKYKSLEPHYSLTCFTWKSTHVSYK